MMEQQLNLHNENLEKYYQLHASIYDWTRWSFLFGRKGLINSIPDLPTNPRILEVGCGTGKNIVLLESRYPRAEIYGIDLSPKMIAQAQKKVSDNQRVRLIMGTYGSNDIQFDSFDLILLSYSLSMLGNRIEIITHQLQKDLATNGYVAVVDFYDTPFKWFEKWMNINHVDMNGTILKPLEKYFETITCNQKKAYFGLWNYTTYIGQYKL